MLQGSQSSAWAFWWNNKKVSINPGEKIQYVNIDWWDNFSDPYIKGYIVQAIENNHTARKASWQVEEFRQNVKYTFGRELPSLSVGGSYVGAHYPEHLRGLKSNTFVVPFTASYEADIFLKNRDKTKSTKKAYEASKWEEKAVYISLATDVATAYLNAIKLDKQVELQQELVEIKREQLKRENAKFNQGVISAQSLNNAQKDYESTKSDLNTYVKTQQQALTQLAVLIGESPENARCLKRSKIEDFKYACPVPEEISSDVIFSRPDIEAVEAKLMKSRIDIRVARKEFLPSINLTGIYAFSNLGPFSFGSWQSTIAAILAQASLDLFKGGMKMANLRIYQSRYEQMFEEYKQTDLTALKEVNDSLFILKQDTQIDENTSKNLFIEQDNFIRSQNRYKNGVISYPQLLTEQEKFIVSAQQKVNSKSTKIVDYFTLYKAVGGQL